MDLHRISEIFIAKDGNHLGCVRKTGIYQQKFIIKQNSYKYFKQDQRFLIQTHSLVVSLYSFVKLLIMESFFTWPQ